MNIRISELMGLIEDDSVNIGTESEISTDAVCSAVMARLHGEAGGSGSVGRTVVRRRKTGLTLLAAVLISALLAGTAYASGVLPPIFSSVENQYPFEEALGIAHPDGIDPDLVNAGRKSVTVEEFTHGATYINSPEPTPYSGPSLPGFTFTISESYYDGKTLRVGYTLEPLKDLTDLNFGPGSEDFDKLEKVSYAPALGSVFSADTLGELEKSYNETGHMGVRYQELYISDHVTLPDGSDVGAHSEVGTDEGRYMFFYCADIPYDRIDRENPPDSFLRPEAQDLDEITLCFKVRSSLESWYYDGTDWYAFSGGTAEERISFTVPNLAGR